MPVLKQAFSVVAHGVKVFLNLEIGVVRDGATPRRADTPKRAQSRAASEADGDGGAGVRPENVIWLFGTGRSGNTWLSSMMEDLGYALWREPSVGKLFGEFYYLHSREGQRGTSNFVLGQKQKGTWLQSIRNFVLEGARGRFPEMGDNYLMIKEQVGSVGAPLLVEALPESRMIFLVRDPRDVVASWVSATRKGGWRYERLNEGDPDWSTTVDEDPITFVRERANIYLRSVGKAKEAYATHRGPKILVRYEELRADTLGTMRRIHAALGVDVDQTRLARVVERHAWENVPENEKGEGKFRRKATPGGWRDDLSPEQTKLVEEITAPLLEAFYTA